MTTRPFIPLYIPDYRADTAHLSTEQHGAYLLLIFHYWAKGGLPGDDESLARIAGLPLARWRQHRATIAAFFSANWKHKRIEFELNHVAARQEAGRKGGVVSGERRRRKRGEANAKQNATDCEANGEANCNEMRSKTQVFNKGSPSGNLTRLSLRESGARAPDPTRLPFDWLPSEADMAFAMRFVGSQMSDEIDKFCNYWRQRAGPDAVKSDWSAAWRLWCQRAVDFAKTSGSGVGNGNGKLSEKRSVSDVLDGICGEAGPDPRRVLS